MFSIKIIDYGNVLVKLFAFVNIVHNKSKFLTLSVCFTQLSGVQRRIAIILTKGA